MKAGACDVIKIDYHVAVALIVEKRAVLDCSWIEIDAIGPQYFGTFDLLILSPAFSGPYVHWHQRPRSNARGSVPAKQVRTSCLPYSPNRSYSQ